MTTHPTDHPTEQQTQQPTGTTGTTTGTTTGGRHRLTETAPTAPAVPAGPAGPQQETSPGSTLEPEARRAPLHFHDHERIASYRRTVHRPPAAQAGAIITLLVGLSVLNAQWALYPTTYQGQSDANWALLFMMVSTGAALRILFGNPGRHFLSVVAILACGVGFVLRGFLIGGGEPVAVDAFEVVCGALLLLGGGLAGAWPALTPEPPAPVSPG